MLILSPLFYFFFPLYLLILLVISLKATTFLIVWVFIEAATLLFWAILFMSRVKIYRSSVIYFIYQSIASLSLLFIYTITLSSFSLLTLRLSVFFIFMKLGLAPLNAWYLYALSFMPKLPIFLSLTTQKLPPLTLLALIYSYNSAWLSSSMLVTLAMVVVLSALLISILAISHSVTLTQLLLISSIFNTVWLLLSVVAGWNCGMELIVAYFYMGVYSLVLFFLISGYFRSGVVVVAFYALIGFPPLPLFFVKAFVVWVLLSSVQLGVSIPFLVSLLGLLVLNASMLVLYFYFAVSPIKQKFSMSFYVISH